MIPLTWFSDRLKGKSDKAFPLAQFLTALFFAVTASAVILYVFFHDTYWIWIPRNGFAAAGLAWYQRTAGMCLTTLVPVFVPKLGMYCQHVGAAIAAPGVRAKKAP